MPTKTGPNPGTTMPNREPEHAADWSIFYSDIPDNFLPENAAARPIRRGRATPDWWQEVIARVTELLRLPENWNSYKAKRVNPCIADSALRLLREIAVPGLGAPTIVPTSSGGVQIEWHENNVDVEIEMQSLGSFSG